MEVKNWIIKTFGLKGSWSWAKRQMMKGETVRCSHWGGALKYKIDSTNNTLLQCTFWKKGNWGVDGFPIWETSNHHLKYEDFTDYIICKWPQ